MADEDEILRCAQDDIGIQDDIGMAHFLLAAIRQEGEILRCAQDDT